MTHPPELVEALSSKIARNIAGQMKAVITSEGYSAFGDNNIDCRIVAIAAITAYEEWKRKTPDPDYWRDIIYGMPNPPVEYDFITDQKTGLTTKVEKPAVYKPEVTK